MRFFGSCILYGMLALPAVSPASLVAYYSFDAGDAHDDSGNGRDGTLMGGPSWTASGYQGGAYSFDGADRYITIPVNINITSMSAITMGGWFQSSIDIGTNRGLISHDDGGYDRTLDMDTRAGGYKYSAFRGTGVLGGSEVVANIWTFVVMRHDESTGWLTLNVDTSVYSAAGVTYGPGLATTTIGKNPTFDKRFFGVLDNVFIFDEYLSDERIEDIRVHGENAIVPEPTTFGLLGIGCLALVRRRRA